MSTEKESSEQVDMSQKDEKNDISKEHVDSNDISGQAFEKWWGEQCDNELFKTKVAVIVKIVEGEAKKAFQAGRASRELKMPSDEEINYAWATHNPEPIDEDNNTFGDGADVGFSHGVDWCLEKIKALNGESGDQ